MKQSIKFEDLAFVLLFFFIVLAVVSFSNQAKSVQHQSSVSDELVSDSIDVFLDIDGNLSQSVSEMEGKIVNLYCDLKLSWEKIQNVILWLNNEGIEVNLVIT